MGRDMPPSVRLTPKSVNIALHCFAGGTLRPGALR
jgi:hypothetical protein